MLWVFCGGAEVTTGDELGRREKVNNFAGNIAGWFVARRLGAAVLMPSCADSGVADLKRKCHWRCHWRTRPVSTL